MRPSITALLTTLAVLAIGTVDVSLNGPMSSLMATLYLCLAASPWVALAYLELATARRAANARRRAGVDGPRATVSPLIQLVVPVSVEEQNNPEFWRGMAEGARYVRTQPSRMVLRTMIEEYEVDIDLGTKNEVAFAKGFIRGALAEQDRIAAAPRGWAVAG